MLVKYTSYFCINESACPHIHTEIDVSCRYVARSTETGGSSICKEVLEKNRQCSAGHDFEDARKAAWATYTHHTKEKQEHWQQADWYSLDGDEVYLPDVSEEAADDRGS